MYGYWAKRSEGQIMAITCAVQDRRLCSYTSHGAETTFSTKRSWFQLCMIFVGVYHITDLAVQRLLFITDFCPYKKTNTKFNTHPRTHAHTQTQTHTRRHARTRTRIHTHTHRQTCLWCIEQTCRTLCSHMAGCLQYISHSHYFSAFTYAFE